MFEAGGATMRYRRDAADRLVRVTDPAVAVTELRYDGRDRLVETRRPDGRGQRAANRSGNQAVVVYLQRCDLPHGPPARRES